MKSIKKIPQIKIISEYRGTSFLYIIYLGLPLFIIVGLLMTYDGLENEKYSNIFYGLMCVIFFGAVGVSVFKGGVYEPEKSFLLERMDKEKLNRYIIYSAIAIAAFCLIIFLLDGKQGIKAIGYSVAGFFGLYYWSKSIKFHEDIDYEANEFIADLIGLNVDEKIVASYQNFDSSKAKRKKNDNLIVVTNRKIFFAVYNGTNWMTLNKLLIEVEKIGIARNDVNSYLKLVFADNTSLGLRLDLYEKITTTPQLFVKQFLNTLDASLLGYDVVSNNNRRRVSISNENISVTNKSRNQSRNIELNLTLVSDLKASEEIKSGRILEI
jgi:hypothetical protein